jgi:hypothetical protein
MRRALLLAAVSLLFCQQSVATCLEFIRQNSTLGAVKYQRYWVCDTQAERPNGVNAGDNAYTKDTGKSWVWTSGSSWADMGVSGGGSAQYWVGAADATLSAEKNLGALGTGLVLNTAGTPSAYAGTSCGASQYTISLNASGVASCSQPTFSDIGGTATDGQIPNTITLDNLTQVTTRAIADTTGTLTVSRGGTGSAPGADDQLLVADSTSAATWRTLTTCTGAGKAVTYDATTNTFGCNTISGGGGNYVEASIAVTSAQPNPAPVTVAAAWVSASSVIVCNVLGTTADGLTPEAINVAGLHVTAENRVASTSFDARVWNPNGLEGTIRVHCTGS